MYGPNPSVLFEGTVVCRVMVPYEKYRKCVKYFSLSVTFLSVSLGTDEFQSLVHCVPGILTGQGAVYEIVEHIHYDYCAVLFHLIHSQIP